MSRDAEDAEHRTFIRIADHLKSDSAHRPESEDDEFFISLAAYRLHAYALVTSLCEGHFGFIPDDYLSSIAAETDITAAELEAAGLWQRTGTGYLVHDRQMRQWVLQADQWAKHRRHIGTERNPSETVRLGLPRPLARRWGYR